tara:strand:+ start:1700 stop:1888 length:189 start_codon:yes stop_codon:yes gene_type:complete
MGVGEMSKNIVLAKTPAEKIRFCTHWLQVFLLVGRDEEAAGMVEKLLAVADELETDVKEENY